MAIEGFEYKEFAESMAKQAAELVPADLKDFEKEYIVKTLGNFTMLTGEALSNDNSLNLTAERAYFITQIIAEWSFHKSMDLIRSGILPQYWDSIMQKIAYTIFEVAKQAIGKVPDDQLLQAVEAQVAKVYKMCIEELEQKGIINEEIKNQAESQSNIDAMAKQAQQAQIEQQQQQQAMAAESAKKAEEKRRKREEERTSKHKVKNAVKGGTQVSGITHKDLKLMSLALLLKILSQDKVTTILNKFNSNDSLAISQYMNMADLESHLDGDLVTDCLNDMKNLLPTKRKLTKENLIKELSDVYSTHPRERVERILKNERPLVKRFASKAFNGEYDELPLRVAEIVTDYIEENV